MAVTASPYLVRPMRLEDIPQVSEIERESFPTLWPQAAYRRELQSNAMARYIVVADIGTPAQEVARGPSGLVARVRRLLGGQRPPLDRLYEDQRLVAFIGLWFLLEECHVVTVAVREAYRRRGVGELLLISAIDLALKRKQEVLTLECRVSNHAAQTLYQKYGFEKVGVRKRYYSDNNEDALIMTTPPIQTTEYREKFEQLRAAHHRRWGMPTITHPEM